MAIDAGPYFESIDGAQARALAAIAVLIVVSVSVVEVRSNAATG